MSEKIAVIGLGYVGLPLAAALAKHFPVTGLDINRERIRDIQGGVDKTGEVSQAVLKERNLRVTFNEKEIKEHTIYIITVPTPITKNYAPDLDAICMAAQTVGQYLTKGAIVVFESTFYPGVTEGICSTLLEQSSNFKSGKDFFLGYSPERINPGDKEHNVEKITKVISGQTDEVINRLRKVYGSINNGNIFVAKSIKTAEAAKVIENTQRDINIAFINEITILFEKMGISIYDVLETGQTKWNFLSFSPGLVGGHCIGVDPYYLACAGEQQKVSLNVTLAGRDVNEKMAFFIANTINNKIPPNSKILILGLTFKENVPDLRNTKVLDLIAELERAGHKVYVHDSVAHYKESKMLVGNKLTEEYEQFAPYDCIVGVVAHRIYTLLTPDKLYRLLKKEGTIIDIKNMWSHYDFPVTIKYWRL
ncbi:MAG: nucleotide sugar dehydrogenase [Alphaproteobacteria bacterium]